MQSDMITIPFCLPIPLSADDTLTSLSGCQYADNGSGMTSDYDFSWLHESHVGNASKSARGCSLSYNCTHHLSDNLCSRTLQNEVA